LRSTDKNARAIEAARWERAVAPLLKAPDEALWREHSDAMNSELLRRWLPPRGCGRALKTDLFDEAMGEGLYPLLAGCARSVAALDLSSQVVASAVARYPGLLAVGGDVRRLPFAACAFDLVVSNSTLDHFGSRAEIADALRELNRVLAAGGRLLLTMDNLANPAVALRNALPFGWLRKLGLVAYPVGVTCGPRRLRAMLREAGFEVLQTEALLHCPRVLAVPLARWLQRRRRGGSRARFLRGLRSWERLARSPTRLLTGYYVGVSARKP
jgi:SAM-dependent methyltransferase